MTILGKNMKRIREERGLSQDEMAILLGYKTRSSICQIEKGKKDVLLETVSQFAEVLGISPLEFFREDKKEVIITAHEEELILAYRNHPEFQIAIDTMLGLQKKSGESGAKVG